MVIRVLKSHFILASALSFFLLLLLMPSLSIAQASLEQKEAEILHLKNKLSISENNIRSLSQEKSELSSQLFSAQQLLNLKPFNPKYIQKTQRGTLSPSPNGRTKLKYVSNPQQRKPKLVKLEDELGKGPVLLAYWATWCKPCVSSEEQAHLKTLQKELERYGIPLLSIGIDDWSKIEKNRGKWYYPLWHYDDGHMKLTPESIMREVGLGLPLFYLRLPNGQVPYYLAKTLSEGSVKEWIIAAVREKLSYAPHAMKQ